MKRVDIMNQIKKFLVLTLAIFALIACKKVDAAKGTSQDHIVSETSFSAIDFGTGGDLTFTESASTTIIVNTTDKVFKAMDIYVKNSTLFIHTKKGYNIKNSEEISVTISAPNVNSLVCSGSGSVDANIENTTEFTTFDLTVSGSGSMQTTGINSTNQNMTVSGSGSLTVDELISESVTAKISGSGGINVRAGETSTADIIVSGSGSYAGFNLTTAKVDIIGSGSGQAEVSVNDELDVLISGSGNVYYKGNPIINVSSTGSGSLINAN
jgi:hypothetical protein